MFFRPIQPRGDVFEATHHLVALCLLLPVCFVMVIGHGWLTSGQLLASGLTSVLFVAALQFYSMLLHAVGWVYVGAIFMLTGLLHFAFYGTLMTVLNRLQALSLINLLAGSTLLAGAAAGILPVLLGYGSTMPKHRLPLLEDFAESFLAFSILLGIGALFEWICIRTGPKPEPAPS
jgi:hypothetical protein